MGTHATSVFRYRELSKALSDNWPLFAEKSSKKGLYSKENRTPNLNLRSGGKLM